MRSLYRDDITAGDLILYMRFFGSDAKLGIITNITEDDEYIERISVDVTWIGLTSDNAHETISMNMLEGVEYKIYKGLFVTS